LDLAKAVGVAATLEGRLYPHIDNHLGKLEADDSCA
jgi:hypothetical protein